MKVCGRIFMFGYRLTIHSQLQCNITAHSTLGECFQPVCISLSKLNCAMEWTENEWCAHPTYKTVMDDRWSLISEYVLADMTTDDRRWGVDVAANTTVVLAITFSLSRVSMYAHTLTAQPPFDYETRWISLSLQRHNCYMDIFHSTSLNDCLTNNTFYVMERKNHTSYIC